MSEGRGVPLSSLQERYGLPSVTRSLGCRGIDKSGYRLYCRLYKCTSLELVRGCGCTNTGFPAQAFQSEVN